MFQIFHNRMEMLHAQLGGLLDNAQALLADAVPTSMMTHQTKNGLATGTTPAVYSCLAMQVLHQIQPTELTKLMLNF